MNVERSIFIFFFFAFILSSFIDGKWVKNTVRKSILDLLFIISIVFAYIIVIHFRRNFISEPKPIDLYEFLVDSELQHYYNSIK